MMSNAAIQTTSVRVVLGALIITALVFAAYWPCLNGAFVWDDDEYVYDNDAVKSPDGVSRIWLTTEIPQYYPLTFTTFWLEWQLWGDRTFGYHLVSIVLHAANAILVWVLFRQLRLPGAWLAALVFAIHPIHVESVAWITQRKNTLSGLFYLAAFISFWKFAVGGRTRWYVATLALLTCALFAKTTTVMFPAVLVVVLWWAGRLRQKRVLLALVPLFAMCLAMSGVTIWYESTQVRAIGEEWSAGLPERIAVAGKIVWFYLYKLLVPLEFIYNYPRWQIDPHAWVSYVPAAAALISLVVMLIRRSPWDRALLAGVGSYVICLFPVMGFFNIYYMRYSFVADHFAYLPCLGVVAVVINGIAHLARRHAVNRTLMVILSAVLIAGLTLQTRRYSTAYEGAETLYRDTLEKNDDSWLMHNQLGMLNMRRHHFAAAETHFRRVCELNPRLEEGYNNLRLALVYQNRYKEAVEAARRGLAGASTNTFVALELARLLAISPDPEVRDGVESVFLGRKVVEATGGRSPDALDVLAAGYAEQGRFDEAVRTAREAVIRALDAGKQAQQQGYAEIAARMRSLADDIQRRLRLYESGTAFHAPIMPPPPETD
ncbi:MAG: glycosyltransferase family 39 protein [Phycisphaerales bacterium]|nr:MAG: glycosyltransferase family 39 protein [Phycisphaerales bacterium]